MLKFTKINLTFFCKSILLNTIIFNYFCLLRQLREFKRFTVLTLLILNDLRANFDFTNVFLQDRLDFVVIKKW